MKTHNILIVDDDELITTTLSNVVTIMLKQNVLAFNDPAEALETVNRDKPDIDLVISDFIMPKINGIEFLKQLREIQPEAVSIILTGYSDKQNAIAGINEAGIFHYMEKPWDNEVLIHTIRNGLEKKRLKDELNQKVIELENRNVEIKDLYSRLEVEYRKETERNVTLEAAVAERTASVRNLLDNAGQGFLSFGPDLLVDQDFSVECRRIFGKYIRGEDFSKLLYPHDEEQQAFIRKLAGKVLAARDENDRELYIPLLPYFAEIGGRSVTIEYKVIRENNFSIQNKMMAIITDVTEKRELENVIEKEKNLFKMIVKVVTGAQDFSVCLTEFQDFLSRGAEGIIMSYDAREALNEIFRRVHTMKGNFSMFYMQKTVECLHSAEDKITRLLCSAEPMDREELKFIVNAIDFRSGFDADKAAIRKILGDGYFAPDNLIHISRATLAEVETKMAGILKPQEFTALAPYIRRIGYRKAGDLLSSFLDYVLVLSERNGKMLSPVKLTGGDTPIDQDLLSGFLRTLVHVFRNSVIHGIEVPEERESKGKEPYGKIFCDIKQNHDFLEITIGDDGRGIDLEAVREKAFQKGLCEKENADGLSDQEAVMLIFNESFSTAGAVDSQSGRGMGLSAVREELLKLDGRVTVKTEKDKGVSFNFVIPVRYENSLPPLEAFDILEPAAGFASRIISKYINEDSEILNIAAGNDKNRLILNGNTVFINIRGQMSGIFFMSFDKGLTDEIVSKSIAVSDPCEHESLTGATLSEIANIILGNCLGHFSQYGDFISIDTPHVLNSSDAVFDMLSSDMRLSKIRFAHGICCVGIVS